MTADQEFHSDLLNRISAAGGWQKRAIAQFMPIRRTLPGDALEAMFRSNYDLDNAIKMLSKKMLDDRNA